MKTRRYFLDRDFGYEITASNHGDDRPAGRTFRACSGRVYQRVAAPATGARSAFRAQCRTIVASPPSGRPNASPRFQPVDPDVARAKSLAAICAFVPATGNSRRADVARVSRSDRSQRIATDQRTSARVADSRFNRKFVCGGLDRRNRSAGLNGRVQKKQTGCYSAKHAALGARTLKTGQSRFFVGYKKHTFRWWLQSYPHHVLLVPLVSWVTPANVGEGCLLRPSIQRSKRRWGWYPQIVVGDMGYIDAGTKRLIRERWQVAVVTKLKAGMKLVPPFETPTRAVCHHGQPLQWLGYDPLDQLHWFGVTENHALCACCWDGSSCPQQFAFAPAEHETLLGLVPMSTRVSRRLLQQVRPWIEPAQSYEKNQLGLGQMFFNSLRLTWIMALFADAAVILRALALIRNPPAQLPMYELTPQQMALNLGLQNEN